MTAVCREYEFLIRRARKEGHEELAVQLETAYAKYLDQATK